MKTIKETTDMFDFIRASVEAVRAARQDGKIDLQDAPLLFTPALKLPAAITGIEDIPAEFADLDSNEIEALTQQFGNIVSDDRYRRAFAGLTTFADAVYEIASDQKAA